ncbi:MAG TPA: EAL domain-containing protein [Bacillus bacterium]|nr:EAL domain-containing protein [Bacillus sp. (in: firmicutes)]
MSKTGKDMKKGLRFAFVFTSIYFIIGIIGISVVDLLINSYREWFFLLITTVIMFYISLKFVYRDREQIKTLVKQQLELKIYKSIFEQMNEGLVITNKHEKILSVNPSFTVMTGYREDEVIGKTPAILSSGIHSHEFYENMKTELQNNGRWQGEIVNQRKNGQIFPEQLSISEIRNMDGEITNYIGVFTDISHQRKVEGKIEFLTHYDSFTKLPKFNLFMKHLHNYITDELLEQKNFSLFIVDTAKLKSLNAMYGHKVGDDLLQTLAIRIQTRYKGLFMGRLNSKEFAIIQPHFYSEDDIKKEAASLLQEIELPFYYEGEEFFLSATIGIGIYPQHGATADELYKNATLAKTAAKEVGYKYQIFGNELLSKVKRKVLLENHLKKAIEMNELQMHYQPQVDIKNNNLVGFEALIRWNHSNFGTIPPAEFIPLAEESGLIIEIGEWVLETVCLQIKEWHNAGIIIPKISVNLSPKQFLNHNLLNRIKSIINKTNVQPSFIELEITENMNLFQNESVVQTLINLKKLGFHLSIDDFGKGHSNLSYLQKLPIDSIKIDRTFISDLPQNKNNIALTKAIIAMAHELQLSVVAEGIETKEQLEFLNEHHCNIAQGFYLSKALPSEEIVKLLLKVDDVYQLAL